MQIGIFAKTFPRPTIEEMFDAVAHHQLDCVQFNMSCVGLPSLPDRIETAISSRIRASAKSRGIALAAVSGTYNMIHPDLQIREGGLKRLRALASACQAIGTEVITLCTGTRDPQNMWRWHPDNTSPQAWNDLLHSMEAALHIAEEEQVILAIEPEQANVVNTAARGHKLLHEMRSPRLKIVFDAANLITSGQNQQNALNEAFALLGEAIIIAHAKDRGPDGTFQAAGEGILDYAHYLNLLQASGFDGPIILHGLDESQVDTSLRFLKDKLATKKRPGL